MAVAHEASSAARLEPAVSAAAERLFEQHADWIYAYCLRQLGSREEAEDAVQATYLNACRSLNDGFEPRADGAWLFKVAQNVCLTRLRSSGRRARVERVQDSGVLEETVAAPERDADDLIGLPEALASLPEGQRRAILLREWQGLSYREVAARLGLSQAAVETLIFRARRSLAAALGDPRGRQRRARAMRALDLAGLLAGAKTLIIGGAATATVVAATAAVVATSGPAPREAIPREAPKAAPAASFSEAPAVSRDEAGGAERRFFRAPPSLDLSPDRARGKALGKAVRGAHGKPAKAEKGKASAKGGQGKARGREHGRGRPSFAGSQGGPPPRASAKSGGKKH
jgi:RNA polymerase sigma-70 factor (ECF subfamily)